MLEKDERWKSPGILMRVECWPHLPHLRLAAKLFLKMDLYMYKIWNTRN